MSSEVLDDSVKKSIINYIDELKKLISENKLGIYANKEVFVNTSWDIINGIVKLAEILSKTKLILNDNINIAHMEEAINFLLDSLNNTDYILVSDIFEYEIVRILNIWEKEIRNFVYE